MKYRKHFKGLSTIALFTAILLQLSCAVKKDTEVKLVDYLYVQNSKQVTLKEGVLTLKGVNTDTLYFSDRPDRIVGRVTTWEFVDSWASGDDSFKQDPPNAVLSILGQTNPQDIVVVLKNPQLKDGDLIYDVRVLDGNKQATGGESALFIDVIGRPLTPLSVAGIARRERRRAVMR